MISRLWQTRDRFPFGSLPWCKAWAKRLLQSPRLFSQWAAHRRLSSVGAKISESAFFSDHRSISGNLADFSVGEDTFIGRVEISAHSAVTIGAHVCINNGVKILTASHEIRDPHWPSFAKPIVIEDYAWIATNAIVLPGVTIGRGAVVAAGAVVSRDVPPGTVAIGNPATIRENQRAEGLDYSPVAHLALFTAWRRVK